MQQEEGEVEGVKLDKKRTYCSTTRRCYPSTTMKKMQYYADIQPWQSLQVTWFAQGTSCLKPS